MFSKRLQNKWMGEKLKHTRIKFEYVFDFCEINEWGKSTQIEFECILNVCEKTWWEKA